MTTELCADSAIVPDLAVSTVRELLLQLDLVEQAIRSTGLYLREPGTDSPINPDLIALAEREQAITAELAHRHTTFNEMVRLSHHRQHPNLTCFLPIGGPAIRSDRGTDLVREVAAGVHRLEHAATNCYLVEEANSDRLTLIDAAFPGTWSKLVAALLVLGRRSTDIADVVLTHGHFDHLGMAARLHTEHGARVWVHPADRAITIHPGSYRPSRPRVLYPLRYPPAIPTLAAMITAGALTTRGVDNPFHFDAGEVLPVIGSPVAVATPGHTDGHCALLLPGRSVIFTGDALVTHDPYTGRVGPRVVARAGTVDPHTAHNSLTTIADTKALTVLPGHGKPWTGGVNEAVRAARQTFPLP